MVDSSDESKSSKSAEPRRADSRVIGSFVLKVVVWCCAGDSVDRHDFYKQLSVLRPDAPVFLAMMNDTRRQVRCLHEAATSNSHAAPAYSPGYSPAYSAVQAYRYA